MGPATLPDMLFMVFRDNPALRRWAGDGVIRGCHFVGHIRWDERLNNLNVLEGTFVSNLKVRYKVVFKYLPAA